MGVKDRSVPDLVSGEEANDRFLRFDIAEANVMSCVGSFGKIRDTLGIPLLPLMTSCACVESSQVKPVQAKSEPRQVKSTTECVQACNPPSLGPLPTMGLLQVCTATVAATSTGAATETASVARNFAAGVAGGAQASRRPAAFRAAAVTYALS